MNHPLSVSSLNEQIKALLETTFLHVYVEGELSRITYHNSGHIYFTLKDATSAISCVMFRGNASKLRFRLEEGLKVVLQGAITLYKPRGSYQINAYMIEPAGHGALALAFEQLKERLTAKGYFDSLIKKTLPKYPKKIALITSASGAALQDMQRVAAGRWPLAELFIYDTLVQGESAASSIVNSISIADREDYDIIVVGRGGGSIEDLWAFNEEIVADAIHKSQTPVVSAVGHEIDWVISDYVADLRAPTPSAAMEMILPDRNEMLMYADSISNQYNATIQQKFYHLNEQIQQTQNTYKHHSMEQKVRIKFDEIKQLRQRFHQDIGFKLESLQQQIVPLSQYLERENSVNLQKKSSELSHMKQLLAVQDPKLRSKRGFAQITQDGKVVDLKVLEEGDNFEAVNAYYRVKAYVEKKEKI